YGHESLPVSAHRWRMVRVILFPFGHRKAPAAFGGAVCFVPASGFAPTLAFTSRGLLSVTGWGHGGGRYSQLLRVVSSRSERHGVLPIPSRSGLRGGGPLVAAASARPVLLGIPLLALRRRARLGRRGGVRPRDYLEPPDCERGRRPLLSV